MFNSLTLLLNKGLFVVGSLLCSQRFFSGYSGFPFSAKTNISKSQIDQESGRQTTTLWMCYLQIFIYFIIILKVNLLKLDNTKPAPFQMLCWVILSCCYHYQYYSCQITHYKEFSLSLFKFYGNQFCLLTFLKANCFS